MGNQLDRITHLNYSELPTGDPSGIEKDELRVGVAYFFSDEEEDIDERVPTEKYPQDPSPTKDSHIVLNETEFSAFCCQECIFSKLRENEDLNVYSVKTLFARCKAGDLLELVCPAADHPSHWAVYVGNGQIVHLHKGEIRKDSLYEIGSGRLGRIVNSWYRYRPLPAELVLQNAGGHLGLKSPEICWTNSESFAAWCRFGKREFKAGGEVQTGSQQYFLKIHLSENNVHTLRFRSLEELIREKRRVDASDNLRVLKELSIVNGKD
ncbi:protein LRATD1 [Latimeria chalumnae]|uniref:LRAT domain containing 1 n=1 Tax=Latimeria chalumnae TaxID=7897 RepID=H3A5B2_LATCH|nr:PREDICTED: protein FAM84A [Latimeria chalumnae]|eukprot:XP_006008609.1 PREDICTED: protein FAM84A [Latimeria chalumnae]